MGRKKSNSTLITFGEAYQKEICATLDKVASPVAEELQSRAATAFANQVSYYWFITACWIAYEISPIVDITREPYLKPEVKAFRQWGKLIYTLLKVCQSCWENSPEFRNQAVKRGIHSPWQWWTICCGEIKTVWAIGDVPAIESKPEFLKKARTVLGELENGKIPSILNCPEMLHNRILIKTVQGLRMKASKVPKGSQLTEVPEVFNLFIGSMRRWIEDFRSQPFTVSRLRGSSVEMREPGSGHWRNIQIVEDDLPSKALSILAPLWRNTKVYVKEGLVGMITYSG